MVRQGKGDPFKAERDRHPTSQGVGNCNKITVLKKPKAKEAMALLEKIATLVHPIMKKHGWTLPFEFFPTNANLLGVNVNGGQKICIRLRPANDENNFYDLETFLMGTMLHELTHNVHGPHDDKFYKFLDGLQDEYDELRRTGYSGQGFLNDGKKLSTESHNLPPGLARERALAEAEKRRKLGLLMGPAGGNKLGGSSNRNAGKSLRQILAEAAERRQRDDKQCDHGDHGEAEAEAVKAEKDSLTVVDLTSSDSEDDLPPLLPVAGPSSSKKPLFLPDEPSDQESTDDEIEVISSTIKPKASSTKSKVQSPPKASTSKLAAPKGIKRKLTPAAAEIASKRLQTESLSNEWSCPACTYVNPSNFLQCEICASVKPSAITNDVEAVVNGPRATQNLRTADSWFCHVCAEENPTERWSCQGCSNIKLSS